MESRAKIARLDADKGKRKTPVAPHFRHQAAGDLLPLDPNDLLSEFGLGWIVLDPEGNLLQCNKVCLKVLGLSPEEIKNANVDDFLAPEFIEPVRERRQRRIRGEELSRDYECRLLPADGREMWVRLFISSVEQDAEVVGVMAIITDITAQKAAEIAQRRREREYSKLLESAETGFVVADHEGLIIDCNLQFLLFIGRTQDSIGKLHFADFLAPEHRADAKMRDALCLLGHTDNFEYEFRCLRPDGSEAWLEAHSVPRYTDGKYCGTESLVWDISEVCYAREELAAESARAQEAAEKLKGIFKSLPANVLLVDENGIMQSISESWQQFADEAQWAEELKFTVGHSVLDLCKNIGDLGEKSAMAVYTGLNQVLNLERTHFELDGDYRFLGETRWFHLVAVPLIPGERKGAVILHQDSTQQHIDNELLRKTQIHLHELVNSTGGILWEADPRTFRFTYVSEAAERILGYPISSWTDDSEFWASHIHDDDRKAAVEFCMNSTARGENHRFKYRMIAADGRIVWIEDVVTVTLKDGQPESLRGVMVDISEDIAQQENLSQISKTLDLSFSEIFIFDAETLVFQYVNQGAKRNLGFSSEQLLKMTPLDINPDYQESSFLKILEPLKEGNVPKLGFTSNHLRADGSTYPCEIHLYLTTHRSKASFLAVALDISARRNREEFHQLLLENVRTGLLLVDEGGHITLANRFMHEMFGYHPGELVGKTIEVLVPKPLRKAHVAQRLEYMEDMQPIHMGARTDLVGLRKDGAKFPVDIEVAPTTISEKPFLLVSVTDLTDRLAIEKEAAKSMERYERVVEHMHDALLVDDLDGQLVYCNDRFLEYFGIEREDVKKLKLEDYIAPEHLETVKASHNRQIKSGGAAEVHEFEGLRKDGSRLWLQARTTQVRKNGEIVGTQSTLLDITESKQIEEELRRAQMHIQELIDGAEGIVWESIPGTLQFSYVSKQAERLLGYPIERWLNEPNFWRDHIHTYDRDMVVREYGTDALRSESHRIEYRMIAADDSVVWLDDLVTVIYQDGKPVLLRGIMVDITERKSLMEALRSLSQREGALVENERRRIAQELHDDYSQRMAFVALRLQSLERKLPSAMNEQKQALEELWSDTKLLSTDLHNLAYELAPTSLRQMGLQGAISNLCDKYFKHFSLPVDFIFSDLPRHLTDSKAIAIYRIVQEALNNVRKHSNSDDATVKLTGVGGNLELLVSDSGEGFDISQSDRMHNLGLMGMAERAYMVGGTWSINSHADSGTVIRVVIPLPVASDASPTDDSATEKTENV